MTPTTALSLSMRLSMFELRETGDWDIFRARGKRRGFSPGAAARHSQAARVYTDRSWKNFNFLGAFFFSFLFVLFSLNFIFFGVIQLCPQFS